MARAKFGKKSIKFKRQAEQANLLASECFMNAPSPGIIATTMLNAYYQSPTKTILMRSCARYRKNTKP